MATARSRRAGVGVLLAVLAGCSAASATRPTAVTPLIELGVVRHGAGAGPDIAVIERPGGELLQLALWVDSGSRDADPPQVAALAAWLAADDAGGGVVGRAWPDGIELSLPCRQPELPHCLARLAAALSLRTPDPARVTDARARLADARRRALAADPNRAADELALETLYGAHGHALFPLGRAADDEHAQATAVRAFLANAFGPRRALLIAAGDIDPNAVTRATAAAFASTPAALQAATARPTAPLPSEEGGLLAGVDRDAALSLAIAAKDLAQAQAAASELRERLGREGLSSAVHGHTFLVRGAALALLRVRTADPEAAVRSAAHEIERLRAEGAAALPQRAARDDLAMLARRLGTRWVTRASPWRGELALGAGVIVAGGRADAVKLDDPDQARRRAAQTRFEAAFQAGRAAADPSLSGPRDDRSASFVLDNGSRLELRKRGGDRLAIAARFGCGAASDPPLWHGRAALLATLGATACAGLDPEELAERLHAIGAELAPRVDAESFGLLLTAPAASLAPALDLALTCALRPTIDRRTLAAGRLKLKQRLGPAGGAHELAAVTSELLAPTAPGKLAPWGSGVRQASIGLAALQELSARCRRGASLAVSVVGPQAIDEVAGRSARRLALASAGRPADEPAPPQPATTATPPVLDQPSLGILIWRTQLAGADPAGGLGLAALVRASVATSGPGLSALWHDGGATADGGWAAVAVSGPPTELAAVAAELGKAAQALSAASLEHAVDAALEQAERTEAASAGSVAAEAETLARAAFNPAARPRNRQSAQALASRLAQSPPLWVPLR